MKKKLSLIIAGFVISALGMNVAAQNMTTSKPNDAAKPVPAPIGSTMLKPETKNDALSENGKLQNSRENSKPKDEKQEVPQFKANPYANQKPLEAQPMKLPDPGPAPKVVPMANPLKN